MKRAYAPASKGADFIELVDLASKRLGGSALWATDDFFASKDNLLEPHEAVWKEGKYTDRGKWMDGWESRRKRHYAESSRAFPDSDTCIIRLGMPGIVRGVVVDTAWFKGNFPQSCAIDGASVDGNPDVETLRSAAWTEILPRAALKGDTKNAFATKSELRFTHLRFHIFPDGGVARLRVHGDVVPNASWLGRRERPQLVDLAAAENGALVVSCNDMFFGSRHNLIMPGRGVNMGDGWETKRSRRAGPDWVVLRLATEGDIERAIVDTLHFKGNAPDACAIDVATSAKDPDGADDRAWRPLLVKTNLQPHTQHVFGDLSAGAASHVRLRIWPDGGISRLRLFGVATDAGRERSGMQHLRSLPDAALRAALLDCCGSRAWVDAVAKERPLKDLATLLKGAARAWDALAPRAWEEAFRAHPRIGEKKATKGPQTTHAQSLSAKEQSKIASADESTLDALRRANRSYERKFGRTYIVCATGKTAAEMLAIAKDRMKNDKKTELRRAADEQKKITELRLEKLVMR